MDGALEPKIALLDHVEIEVEIRLDAEPAETVNLPRRLDRPAGVAEQDLRRHRPFAGPAWGEASARGARIVRLSGHQRATSDVEGFATAAAALFVRVLEDEARLD